MHPNNYSHNRKKPIEMSNSIANDSSNNNQQKFCSKNNIKPLVDIDILRTMGICTIQFSGTPNQCNPREK
ncbi:hypothetical protein RST01_14730 [Rummeliibacillus stabekisii]|nr:hypothetical protein RST01_14730 [Rummeliibacillus stabekisii]